MATLKSSDFHNLLVEIQTLHVAGNKLAKKARQLLEFTREHIATANDLHEVFELAEALDHWHESTS